MKLNKNNKLWTELQVQPNGKVRILRAQKYVRVNQHLSHWADLNARDVARALNTMKLVTR
jgi:hypothetical protein